jgi:AcrR family transcriptional regulator
VSASLSPEEIRASAEIHRELGPEYQEAVIESFIERVGREIDARVDSRLAAAQQNPVRPVHQPRTMALAITSIALGIPLSGIALGLGSGAQLSGLAIIWVAIAVINVAYALAMRRS